MRSFHVIDIPHISSWLVKRGMLPLRPELIPPTGIIEEHVACGFLINTDCGIGIFDFFITNPDVDQLRRKNAIREIAYALTLAARKAGMKAIKCDTRFSNIKELAKELNFTPLGDVTSFFKEL